METLTTMCVGHTSGGHGASTNRPGDGKCDLLAIAKYHKQQEVGRAHTANRGVSFARSSPAVSVHACIRHQESGKDPDCGSNEIREEIDCETGTALYQ
jgi:hypothetical protein